MASIDDIERLFVKKITTLEESLKNDISAAKTEIVSSISVTLKEHSEKIVELEKKVAELSKKEIDRAERELQLDVLDRKNNIVIYKIAETEDSQDALQRAIIRMFNEKLENVFDLRDLDYLFRLGKKKEGEIRPILARFTSRIKKDLILKNKRKLSELKIEVAEDFPVEIRCRRKNAAPLVKGLKEQGFRATLKVDKIVVNGEFWPIQKAEDVLNQGQFSESDRKSESSKNKRSRTSPEDQRTGKKKSSFKMTSTQNTASPSASSIKQFFASPSIQRKKAPTLEVSTPQKNTQYVNIINEE